MREFTGSAVPAALLLDPPAMPLILRTRRSALPPDEPVRPAGPTRPPNAPA